MKFLLIGSRGQLGTDFQKIISSYGHDLISFTSSDLDITDKEKVRKTIKDICPNVVINTAAYHKVDECEKEEERTLKVNVIGVKNLAEVCTETDSVFVHFSTDYVFGKDKNRKIPYAEEDIPGPVNMYGVSKLAAEKAVQYLCEKYFIIRVSGLFGVAGSAGKGGNFIETMIRISKEKNIVSVVNDQILTPTYTLEVARNTIDLLKTDLFGLYHMTSEGQCSWYEFAKEIFRKIGIATPCKPTNSLAMKTIAQRPCFSVLENSNLKRMNLNNMNHWKIALGKYLQEKGYI